MHMDATWIAVMAADSDLSQTLGGSGLTTFVTKRRSSRLALGS
jgi:hypothetical protein